MHAELIADRLAALGSAPRLRLYRLLVRAGETGLKVGELQALLAMPASTLAHHLATLVRTGLVTQERNGRETLSFANYAVMRELTGFLTAECCAGIEVRERAESRKPGGHARHSSVIPGDR